jgi:hypothetical protein
MMAAAPVFYPPAWRLGMNSHNEYWLETDARLRTDFNIDGPKSNDTFDEP